MEDLESLKLPKLYDYQVLKRDEDRIVVRVNVFNEAESKKWLDEYELVSATSWRVSRTWKRKSFLMCKEFRCQHYFSAVKRTKRACTGCEARYEVKIKNKDICSQQTLNRDPSRQTHPCFIKLTLKHNHPLGTLDYVQHLRVAQETKNAFLGYFQMGYSVPEALRHHAELLELSGDPEMAANTAINPRPRVLYHLYEKYRKDLEKGEGGEDKDVTESQREEGELSREDIEKAAQHLTALTMQWRNNPKVRSGLRKFQKMMSCAKTSAQWANFLHTFGPSSSSSAAHTVAIVKPAPLTANGQSPTGSSGSKRKPGRPRGSKTLHHHSKEKPPKQPRRTKKNNQAAATSMPPMDLGLGPLPAGGGGSMGHHIGGATMGGSVPHSDAIRNHMMNHMSQYQPQQPPMGAESNTLNMGSMGPPTSMPQNMSYGGINRPLPDAHNHHNMGGYVMPNRDGLQNPMAYMVPPGSLGHQFLWNK